MITNGRWSQMEDDHKRKMTSNGRLHQILNMEYLSNYWSDLSQILNLSLYDRSKLQMKRISNGRWPKWKTTSNIECSISQQLLFSSLPNLNCGLYDSHWPNLYLQTQLSIKLQSNCLSLVELSSSQLVICYLWWESHIHLELCSRCRCTPHLIYST